MKPRSKHLLHQLGANNFCSKPLVRGFYQIKALLETGNKIRPVDDALLVKVHKQVTQYPMRRGMQVARVGGNVHDPKQFFRRFFEGEGRHDFRFVFHEGSPVVEMDAFSRRAVSLTPDRTLMKDVALLTAVPNSAQYSSAAQKA